MKAEVFPSKLSGRISPPPSKSIAQRAVACALMAPGESVLTRFPDSDDPVAALRVAQELGAIVELKGETVHIRGGFPHNFRAGIRNPRPVLHCGESGLASRLFAPVAALHDQAFTVEGEGTLTTRPFGQFEDILPQLGVKCSTQDGLLPMHIQGPLRGGHVKVDGSISSQFVTGLLMALPKVGEESAVEVISQVSTPYIDMTLAVCSAFGVQGIRRTGSTYFIQGGQQYHPRAFEIPGDWSGASFLLVAAAICGDPWVELEGLDEAIPQADMRMMDALESAGVRVERTGRFWRVHPSEIEPFQFDATDCPDLFPPLAAMAAFARGVSVIRGVNRLHHKESNRAKVLQEEFARANIRIVLRDDEMKIYPGYVRPAEIRSHGDHRIAMAAALLGLGGARITIRSAECVSKSYPHFFRDLALLGGKVNIR